MMKPKVLYGLLKETVAEWSADKVPRLGAALAYYTVFSLGPLLVIVLAVAGVVFGEEAAGKEVIAEISDTFGEPVGHAADDILKQAANPLGCGLAALFGIVMLLFGASGIFSQLQDALNTIWKVEPKPGRGILGIVRDRSLSFLMVLGSCFLLLVSLILTAVLSALSKWWTPDTMPGGIYYGQVLNNLVSFGVITLLFAMIYKFLPDAQIHWSDVWIGAAATALLFTGGKHLLGIYLGQSGVTSAYGAAGSLVLILLWVYYSSQILLFGAEFTRVYAIHQGSGVKPTANAVLVSPEARTRQGMAPAATARPTG
jgi:membrane protein